MRHIVAIYKLTQFQGCQFASFVLSPVELVQINEKIVCEKKRVAPTRLKYCGKKKRLRMFRSIVRDVTRAK